MFQRAEPEEPGLGVMMPMPGLIRSSQDLMFFGLPLRTTKTTTDWLTMPLCSPAFQSGLTSLASTRRVMSPSSEKCTTSAFRPLSTARLWSPEAPYDVLKETFLPSSVFSKSVKIFLLACSRTEKPTRLTVSVPLPEGSADAPQPVRPTRAATDAATAVFHLVFMMFLLIVDPRECQVGCI